jgi:hypothetical protein
MSLWTVRIAAVALLIWGGWLARGTYERAHTAKALSTQVDAKNAALARITALQSQLDAAKEAEHDLPNGNDIGLSAGRVRLLPQR